MYLCLCYAVVGRRIQQSLQGNVMRHDITAHDAVPSQHVVVSSGHPSNMRALLYYTYMYGYGPPKACLHQSR